MEEVVLIKLTIKELREVIKECIREVSLEKKVVKKKNEKYLTNVRLREELLDKMGIEVSRTTLYSWKKNRRLPFHQFGNKTKYLLSEVLEWGKTNRVRQIYNRWPSENNE